MRELDARIERAVGSAPVRYEPRPRRTVCEVQRQQLAVALDWIDRELFRAA